MRKIETTTDCLYVAEELKKEASKVTNHLEHGKWWNKKVDVLRTINGAFETGYFTGEAYDELWMAKHIIAEAEKIAGQYVYFMQNGGSWEPEV